MTDTYTEIKNNTSGIFWEGEKWNSDEFYINQTTKYTLEAGTILARAETGDTVSGAIGKLVPYDKGVTTRDVPVGVAGYEQEETLSAVGSVSIRFISQAVGIREDKLLIKDNANSITNGKVVDKLVLDKLRDYGIRAVKPVVEYNKNRSV